MYPLWREGNAAEAAAGGIVDGRWKEIKNPARSVNLPGHNSHWP